MPYLDPEKKKAYQAQYYVKRREKFTQYKKEWVKRNPEKVIGYRRISEFRKNKEKYRVRRAKYVREREHADYYFKLTRRLRSRIRDAIKFNRLSKSARTTELLGCPIIWLEVHLESLFKPGMTWENYGPVWHIDHVRPCASFDLTKPEHQRWCFHWTNLQPLFALENIRKGAKFEQ